MFILFKSATTLVAIWSWFCILYNKRPSYFELEIRSNKFLNYNGFYCYCRYCRTSLCDGILCHYKSSASCRLECKRLTNQSEQEITLLLLKVLTLRSTRKSDWFTLWSKVYYLRKTQFGLSIQSQDANTTCHVLLILLVYDCFPNSYMNALWLQLLEDNVNVGIWLAHD